MNDLSIKSVSFPDHTFKVEFSDAGTSSCPWSSFQN
jgi:hypothetical protein